MAKQNYQRLKPLRLMELLTRETDEEHPMTKTEICRRLSESSITCDPRTLARDIEALNQLGYEIMETMVGHNRAYYVADRPFSAPELKVMIDAVEAATFITEDQTQDLINKIAAMGGAHYEANLRDNLVCFNTRKHSNKQILYSIDTIDRAIRQKKRIRFFYFKLDENGKKVYGKSKWKYKADPLALVFSEDNYYLMTFHSHLKTIVNYRVDRMEFVEMIDEELSEGAAELLEQFNVGEYTEQVFKMYNGEVQTVVLEFSDTLCGCIYDKFGEDTRILRVGLHTCRCEVTVQRSRVFESWVYQFGDQMKIAEVKQD